MTGDRFEERRKECTSSPRSLARSPWRLGDRGSVCVAIVRPQDHGRFHSRPTGSKESSAGECVEERFVVPLFNHARPIKQSEKSFEVGERISWSIEEYLSYCGPPGPESTAVCLRGSEA